MKKIVGLLAMLALVFVLAGCPDPVNPPASEPGSDPAIGGETFTKPENVVKEFELVKNPYADGGALETQIKIPTGFDKLAVGDKVRLVMKGAVNPALGAMEICLVDTTEAAGWWKMLDDNKYEAKDMVNFDIDYTFTVTQAPIGSGSDSMMIVINGKDNDVTKTMYCTEYSVTIVADEGEPDPEPTPVPDPEPTPVPDPEPIGIMDHNAEETKTVDLAACIAANGIVAGDNVTVTVVLGVPTAGNKVQGQFWDNKDHVIQYEMEEAGATEYVVTGDIDGFGDWCAIQLWWSQEPVTVKSCTIVKR